MSKHTPLFEEHQKLGAKMIDFAGWTMPVSFSSIIEEHKTVRHSVGIFDINRMGIVEITGEKALEFIQQITTNDASKLSVNQSQYSILCNAYGGAIDDILVYRLEGSYRLVINASNEEKDLAWLNKNKFPEIGIKNLKNSLGFISVQGPKTEEFLQSNFSAQLTEIKRNHCVRGLLFNFEVLLSRTGYTGEDGFEVFCNREDTKNIWNKLIEHGANPCGLGARDTLRLEAGLPLYGHEYDEETSPADAGYTWAIKFYKDFFIGKASLEKGPHKKMVGLTLNDKRVPRQGFTVFSGVNGQAKRVGIITSGTMSPSLEKPIGLAYIDKAFPAEVGQELFVEIRGTKYPARITKLPFYKRNN